MLRSASRRFQPPRFTFLFIAALIGSALPTGVVEAQDILIDDFTTGVPFSQILMPGHDRFIGFDETGLDADHTVGGTRGFWLDSCLSSGTMPVAHDTTAGTWEFGGTPESSFCEGPSYSYGEFGQLNLELANVTGVRVTLDILDPGQPNPQLPSSIRMWMGTQTLYSGLSNSFATVPMPTSLGQSSVFLPISSFTPQPSMGGVTLSDVDKITISLSGAGFGAHLIVREFAFVTQLDGDLNGDGFVGVDDLNILLANWNQNVTPGDLLSGDATGEGFVGVDDLNILLINWNVGTPPPAEARVIPEPTAGMILAISSLYLIRRRS